MIDNFAFHGFGVRAVTTLANCENFKPFTFTEKINIFSKSGFCWFHSSGSATYEETDKQRNLISTYSRTFRKDFY